MKYTYFSHYGKITRYPYMNFIFTVKSKDINIFTLRLLLLNVKWD